MKNGSISLICKLAFSLALNSAFITANQFKAFRAAVYKAYYISSDALFIYSPLTNATADVNKVGSALHISTAFFEVDPYGTFTTDVNHMCVAEIAYDLNGTPSSGNIPDFKTGDNSLDY